MADPNYKITQQEYEAQFNFLKQVKDKFNEIQKAIKDIGTCAPRSMILLPSREKIVQKR